MNNKKLGTAFEQELCDLLNQWGWWSHFMSPDNRGAQPFDVIAAKNGLAVAIDCKTCARKTFDYDRLEENQKLAFEKWLDCGNAEPMIAVKHKDMVYFLFYSKLKEMQKIKLVEREPNVCYGFKVESDGE